MTQGAFIRRGHGYEVSERGRCEAFDGFEIIANPLGEFDEDARESRVFGRKANGNGGTTYGSHSIKLGRESGLLFILMHHGGGREVLALPTFYDGGALEAAILAMPEREQYALLYTIYQTARNARDEASSLATREWKQAIADKRIRRRKGRIEIIPQWEIDMKASA